LYVLYPDYISVIARYISDMIPCDERV